MRRIDTSTKAVDLFGAGKHGFKNGDPSLAILATKLNAEFFNATQEELASLIEYAGLTLSNVDNTQLRQAIIAMITAAIPPVTPYASTTVKGLVELADSAETLALADTTRSITPGGLAALMGRLQVSHVVAQNTAVSGAAGVNTRPLNTVDRNTIVGASLSSNQITLPAGTYLIDGFGVCATNIGRTYLYNVTDAANSVLGASEYNAGGGNDTMHLRVDGVFTIAAAKVFEIRHNIATPGSTTYALGRPTNLVGSEIYAAFTIRRIA